MAIGWNRGGQSLKRVLDSLLLSGFFIAFSIISLSILKGFVERDLNVILPRLLAYLNSKVTLAVSILLFSTLYIGSFFWGKQTSETMERHQTVEPNSKGDDLPFG